MLFRKGKTMKSGKYLRVPVIAVIIISLILGTTSFADAAAKPKLSAQQLSIRAGSTSELRVKNTDKKIDFFQKNTQIFVAHLTKKWFNRSVWHVMSSPLAAK